MADHIGNNVDRDSIFDGGYSEIIVKETGGFPANVNFGDIYKARAVHQDAFPGKDAAYVSILVFGYNIKHGTCKFCMGKNSFLF